MTYSWLEETAICKYCGAAVKKGDIIMISGFTGCPECTHVQYGLADYVRYIRETDYAKYVRGDWYPNGFARNKEELKKANFH